MRIDFVKTCFVLAALACAGCSTTVCEPTLADVKSSAAPETVARTSDPNPFTDYGVAMSSDPAKPMAVEWQATQAAALAQASDPEAVKAVALDPDAAKALLAQVKGAYGTDPAVATKIAFVSQMVMCTKWSDAPKARPVWTAALVNAVRDANDAYRANFYLDQLRWCGCKADAVAIRTIANKTTDRAVRDFARMVAREIESAE